MLRFHTVRSGLCGVIRFVGETFNATWRLQTHGVRRGAQHGAFTRCVDCRNVVASSMFLCWQGSAMHIGSLGATVNWGRQPSWASRETAALLSRCGSCNCLWLLTYANCSASWL